MFWTDINGDDIKRANLDGSDVKVLINAGLSAPSKLAIQHNWEGGGEVSKISVINFFNCVSS